MPRSTTAGESGGLSYTTERMPGVTHCLRKCCILLYTSLHSGSDSTHSTVTTVLELSTVQGCTGNMDVLLWAMRIFSEGSRNNGLTTIITTTTDPPSHPPYSPLTLEQSMWKTVAVSVWDAVSEGRNVLLTTLHGPVEPSVLVSALLSLKPSLTPRLTPALSIRTWAVVKGEVMVLVVVLLGSDGYLRWITTDG